MDYEVPTLNRNQFLICRMQPNSNFLNLEQDKHLRIILVRQSLGNVLGKFYFIFLKTNSLKSK